MHHQRKILERFVLLSTFILDFSLVFFLLIGGGSVQAAPAESNGQGIDTTSEPPTPKVIVNVDFENGMPPGINAYSVTTAIDTDRAHSGRAALRITNVPTVSTGTFTFNLDGRIDFSSNAEFSLWLYAEPDANSAVYISANDGTRRYSITGSTPIKHGQWTQVTGRVHASDWCESDKDFKLVIRTSGTCWIDDVLMSTGTPETPSQVWFKLKQLLHTEADKRVSSLSLGDILALDARNAVFAPDTASVQTMLPATSDAAIPAEGLLVFAVDVKDDLELTGTLHLEPDIDLRPAIRVTVLCNDTVIGVPSVKAAPWESWGSNRPGPMPENVRGERPPSIVELTGFRMTKGRHYITIAGPHIRPGGIFNKLELRADARPAEKPLYTFGMFADTHIGVARSSWANTKLLGPAAVELEAALRQLKNENAEFAIIAGDMTDHAWRKEAEIFAGVVERSGLPVYGCKGNHDSFDPAARTHYASLMPKLFPSGPESTDYAFARPPLRFIVLDGSYWRDEEGKLHEHLVPNAHSTYRDGITDWLRETLAKNTTTPTIVVSHFLFHIKGGMSDITGYNGEGARMDKEIMPIIDAAPNVVATFSGHHHYNSFSTHNGITCFMIPAFAEWPNAYHVCRVYPNRLEWEIRQFSNRGFIREGVVKEMALLWMLHTTEGDLSGAVSLVPRKP